VSDQDLYKGLIRIHILHHASENPVFGLWFIEELARHLTIHGVIRHEDGTYAWKFDNFVRAVSPYLFNLDEAREIWSHISCPVLLIRGRESWAPDPEVDGRARAFRDPRIVTIDQAGHWVHHDQLDSFLEQVRPFLGLT